uniref:Uncharacterized protein n=1 Tax=Romanomermis culicivorax TaxID=13658 RepID=A0A915I2K9_ROMCU
MQRPMKTIFLIICNKNGKNEHDSFSWACFYKNGNNCQLLTSAVFLLILLDSSSTNNDPKCTNKNGAKALK